MGQVNSLDHYLGRTGSKDRQSYHNGMNEIQRYWDEQMYRNMYYHQQAFLMRSSYHYHPSLLLLQQQQQQMLCDTAAAAAATTAAIVVNTASPSLYYPQTAAAAFDATPIYVPPTGALTATTPSATSMFSQPYPNGIFCPRYLKNTYV